MDFENLKGKIFYKNKFIPFKKAKIGVMNHSLHFSASVFEGIGVYNGKPLFNLDHLKRFLVSAKLIKLNCNYSLYQLENIILKLIRLNKLKNGYIRPILFRSSNSMSPDTTKCKSILAIASWEWPKLFNKKNGISLTLSKYPRLEKKIYPIEAKSSGSYQTSVISGIDANKKKFDDCLMLDQFKNIAETSACNIFWIKNDVVFTSKTHSILSGITRQSIIRICKKRRIKIKIGNFKLKNLLSSDYIFVTGTAAEIQVVRKIQKKKYSINSSIINILKKEYDNCKSLGIRSVYSIK